MLRDDPNRAPSGGSPDNHLRVVATANNVFPIGRHGQRAYPIFMFLSSVVPILLHRQLGFLQIPKSSPTDPRISKRAFLRLGRVPNQ